MRLLSLVCLAAFALSACRSTPKPSTRLYEGDAPTIRFHESHAGGPVGSY
jgi:hypothetical protein